jgi:hypothetical protein
LELKLELGLELELELGELGLQLGLKLELELGLELELELRLKLELELLLELELDGLDELDELELEDGVNEEDSKAGGTMRTEDSLISCLCLSCFAIIISRTEFSNASQPVSARSKSTLKVSLQSQLKIPLNK